MNDRERIERLQRELQTACEWGAAFWNTRDGGCFHLPDEFRATYVEGSRTVAIIDADTGEDMTAQ